ncbi:hypothetical protein B9Z55_019454 [Caenorhabditis nigoni]|uniref:Uncharacterized protein n=1 Tax=Caenorhabditis nigoni TaxID=1611254 RepID=A0A2G5TIM3_9PELO|nr:hypothetical protein B9Z55_019454 [Caenorhabditis nigoni]
MVVLLRPLLYLFFNFSIFISEQLPEHRKSCSYRKIEIQSENYKHVEVLWTVPEEKSGVLAEECDKAKRSKRSLRTMLPGNPGFYGYKMNETDRFPDDKNLFRKALRSLLVDQQVEQYISSELIKLIPLGNHSEPYIRLGKTVKYAKCIDNRTIDITARVLVPETLKIWKCEDIGAIKNDIYEFYDLSPVWMVEDEKGNTFKINLHNCRENKFNKTLCEPGDKVWYNASCSINRVETCVKTTGRPKGITGSYMRTLPDGIAIYGTFRHFSKIDPTSSRKSGNATTHTGFGSISPGLYYFSFNNTEKFQ